MKRIFISSNYEDRLWQSVLSDAIRETGGLRPEWSITSSAGSISRDDSIARAAIEKADALIIVLGPPRVTTRRQAGREDMADVARRAGKPVFLFVHTELQPWLAHGTDVLASFDHPEQLHALVVRALTSWMANKSIPDTFQLTFSPSLTEEQVKACLFALADYYRACGGVGLQADFDLQEILVREPDDVLA